MLTARQLWDGLQRVRFVRFISRSDTPGWNGIGFGSVAVESPSEEVLVYVESGIWQLAKGRETRFSNVFRWTLTGPELIRLEHLRFGADRPVFLFDVAPGSSGEWASVRPHL
jgi:hypothetical protein